MRFYAWQYGLYFMALAAPTVALGQTSATLGVQVEALGGLPIGLLVVATLSVPDSATGFKGQRAFAAVTDVSGKLSFPGLPFGVYSVCVEPINLLFVDPCSWAAPLTIHLTTQHPSDTMTLPLGRGVPVDIRIDDPEGLLAPHNNGSRILVGIDTPARKVHLMPFAQDAGGVNYRIIAPPGVAASVQVAAGTLQIVNIAGVPVDFSGPEVALNPGTADTTEFFRFVIRKGH